MYDEIDYLLERERGHYCFDCGSLVERALKVIERLEEEQRRPREPEKKEHERALEWLWSVCGGPAAVAAMDDLPLSGPVELPAGRTAAECQRLAAVDELLATAARAYFDDELALAFRRALARLWEIEPLVIAGARPATQVAAGICHAVASANGLFGSKPVVRQATLREHFGVTQGLAVYSGTVVEALRGFWPWHSFTRPWMLWRQLPDLTALGYADLLTGRVRSQLLRVRDQALAAAAVDTDAA